MHVSSYWWQRPVSRVGRVIEDEEEEEVDHDQENEAEFGEEEEIPLTGQHDRPLPLNRHTGKGVTFQANVVGEFRSLHLDHLQAQFY